MRSKSITPVSFRTSAAALRSASWRTPGGDGVGAALLEAVWEHLAEIGVADLAITAAKANVDSHRFYEGHGFTQSFVVYYGKRDAPAAPS